MRIQLQLCLLDGEQTKTKCEPVLGNDSFVRLVSGTDNVDKCECRLKIIIRLYSKS